MRESALALRRRYPRRPDRGSDARRQPRTRLAFRQAGADRFADPVVGAGRRRPRAIGRALAERLGVKVIHIAERDTQVSTIPKEPGEFVNTWSIDGFFSEGSQPAELGWGTHERHFPADGRRHDFGGRAAIYLLRPGAARASAAGRRSRALSRLSDHARRVHLDRRLSDRQRRRRRSRYRPTCHYAYHPCDDAVLSLHELAGKNWQLQDRKRLMMEEITEGIDELGVLLMGPSKGVYWYGSRLSIAEARERRAA